MHNMRSTVSRRSMARKEKRDYQRENSSCFRGVQIRVSKPYQRISVDKLEIWQALSEDEKDFIRNLTNHVSLKGVEKSQKVWIKKESLELDV